MPNSALSRLARRIRYEAAMRGFDGLRRIGLGGTFLRNRPGGRILLYHGVDRRGGSGFNARFVGLADFAQQVQWMSDHFRIVSLDDFFAGVRDPTKFTVALTFDDGYATWLDLVLPVLEQHRAPAAFFVTTIRAAGEEALWPDRLDIAMHLHREPIRVGSEVFLRRRRQGDYVSATRGDLLKSRCKKENWEFIQSALAAFPSEFISPPPQNLAPYWRMLDEGSLRRLAQSPLVTIGSHGVRHLTLPHQDPLIARAEMADSKRWIEAVIGREVHALAFPDGAWNTEMVESACRLQYRQLLGGDDVGDGSNGAEKLRGRLMMNPYISWMNQVRCIYAGGYG